MRAVVVGGGLVGLCVAVQLAQRGAHVTILDSGHPGMGTSATTYAWVNANDKEPSGYFDLNRAGIRAHKRWAEAERGDWLAECGHVEVATDPEHQTSLSERLARHQLRGYAAEAITPSRARELVPDLRLAGNAGAIAYFAEEGFCVTALFTAYLLRRAASLGVTVRGNAAVTTIVERSEGGATVVVDGDERIDADVVVAAAGRGISRLLDAAGVRLNMVEYEHPGDATVGYLAVTNPLPVSVGRLVTSSALNVRPEGGGRLMLQALDLDASADPAAPPATDGVLASEYVGRLRGLLANTQAARIDAIRVGRRVLPGDALSVIGRLPDMPSMYVVATHSGVTLAPLLGEGVAAEVFGEEQALFADFRPDRLLGDKHLNAPTAPRRAGQQ